MAKRTSNHQSVKLYNIYFRITWTSLFLLIFLCVNTSFAQKQRPRDKKKPKNGVKAIFDYLPADNFDSRKYGLFSRFTMFEAWNAAFTSSLSGWYRRTNLDPNGYFPKDIYSINYSLGIMSKKVLINGSIGSTSDKPFHSGNELIYGGLAAYNVLNNSRHSLFLGAFFSSRLVLPGVPVMPLPIIIYMYRSKNFVLVLPFISVYWKINDSFSLKLGTDQQFGQKVSFKYHITRGFYVATELSLQSELILVADRANTDENLYLSQNKMGIRVSWLILSGFFGYSLGTRYYRAETVFSDKVNVIDLDNSLTFDLALRFAF